MITPCILHFGLHKTGTSSIQRFLRHDLCDRRFFYPVCGDQPHLKDNCHNRLLCCALRIQPEKYHLHAKEKVSLAELRARGEWLKNAMDGMDAPPEAETLVLSAEESSNYETPELARLVTRDFSSPSSCRSACCLWLALRPRYQELAV